jgi:hypothetical protein
VEAGRVTGVNDEEDPKVLHGEMDRRAVPLVVRCIPTKDEALAWCQEWMQLLTPDLLAINSEMQNGLQLIHKTYEIL